MLHRLIYRCLKETKGIRNTRYSRNWFWYETFIHLFEFKGFSTWGERDTIFLGWLLLHRQLSAQPTCSARSAKVIWPRPALNLDSLVRRQELNSLTFSKSQNPQLILPGMTSFTSLVTFPHWGSILTTLNDTSSPRAREHLH